jgi:phage N-6-adenine-methyltransferase
VRGQKQLFSSNSDEWGTPKKLLAELEEEFGAFDLDPCATDENHVAPKWFTKEQDGLKQPWFGRVFVNPPYSDIKSWTKKCWIESKGCLRTDRIVYLVPARTDTKWFHEYIWDKEKHTPLYATEVRFIKGRLRFEGGNYCAPFPSMLVIWRK